MNAGPAIRIMLKKGRDGPPTLACVRADGSRTWSKLHPSFPVHDLTHYAAETVLGFDQAFFGLVAAAGTSTTSRPGHCGTASGAGGLDRTSRRPARSGADQGGFLFRGRVQRGAGWLSGRAQSGGVPAPR